MAKVEIEIPDEYLETYQRMAVDGTLGKLSNVVCQLKDCRDAYEREDEKAIVATFKALPPEQRMALQVQADAIIVEKIAVETPIKEEI
jgi:F0F1-type ATP synthase delta subunit